MVQRIGGNRRNTRFKFQKSPRTKGKMPITRYISGFNAGDKVALVSEPSVFGGLYHPRFHGKTGIVGEKKGRCYEVMIKDGSLTKNLIVHPVHLKRL